MLSLPLIPVASFMYEILFALPFLVAAFGVYQSLFTRFGTPLSL